MSPFNGLEEVGLDNQIRENEMIIWRQLKTMG